MVAALILWTEAQSIVGSGECTTQTYFPSFKKSPETCEIRIRRQFTWYCTWAPQRCGTSTSVSAKASSIVQETSVTAFAAPSGPVGGLQQPRPHALQASQREE